MSKRVKIGLLVVLGIYLLLALVLVVSTQLEVRDLYSPPRISRDTKEFRGGSLGLFRAPDKETDQVWPANLAMAKPVEIEGEEGAFLLDWSTEESIASGIPRERWFDHLQDGESLDLVAFAIWTPGVDDPLPPLPETGFPLRFFDPQSLTELKRSDLEDRGVPSEFFELAPPRKYHAPRIRLLFRHQGFPHLSFHGIQVGDKITGARISYDLESLNEVEKRSQAIGEWACLDSMLLLWHDTPLTIQVEVMSGEEDVEELVPSPGNELVFGDDLRIQWVTRMQGDIDVRSWIRNFTPKDPSFQERVEAFENYEFDHDGVFQINPDKDLEPGDPDRTLIRASSPSFLEEHTALLFNGELNSDWTQEEENGNYYLASIESPISPEEPLRFVFFRDIVTLRFEVAGHPLSPNPQPEDLFELNLPRITLSEKLPDAEQQLVGYLSVAAQIEWDADHRWSEEPPAEFPANRTFRNTSPQELLDWYLANTNGSFARYDEDELKLSVNETGDGWWSSITNFLRGLNPLYP